MLELLPSPGPDVVVLRASGKVVADDIDLAWASIDAALDEADRIGLYAEFDGVEGISLDGLARSLAESFDALSKVGRFARYAVVTDARWLRTIADLEGKLIPGLELRTYPLAEKDTAMAWLTAHTAPQSPAPDRSEQ